MIHWGLKIEICLTNIWVQWDYFCTYLQSNIISSIAAKVDMTQALSLQWSIGLLLVGLGFFLVINFILKMLSSLAYFVDVYKNSKAEFEISATKLREKSSIIFII